MAKKLVYNYTFTPGGANSGTIVIHGNYPLKVFQLITNTTDNIIIYNFSAPSKGGTVSYDSALDETTLTLAYDTSAMSSTDELQIFIDIQEEKINFSETFTDPVSKLRVSNPQNLIDTDFEYGLQPTKWETVELVNNIPSFFASSNDYSISDIVSVTTLQNSENVTVTTLENHGLSVGSPIDVQGLSSRTAEGKFLVSSIISTTKFVYKAKTVQAATATISGSYTVIVPGEFYTGSDIKIDNETGIETDGQNPSLLKLTTDYHHGFSRGTSLYFTNTIGSKNITLGSSGISTAGDTAPDGRAFVDFEDTISTTLTTTPSLTETRQMTGIYAHKFSSSDVDTQNNTITWEGHSLQAGDVLLYSKPSGDTAIGGLDNFQIYYVKSAPSKDTITLCATTNGNYAQNSTIGFSSAGTSTYGRHILIFGYEIRSASKSSRSYTIQFDTRYRDFGSGSGRDRYTYTYDGTSTTYGYFGLGGKKPSRYLFAKKSSGVPSSNLFSSSAPFYGTSRNSNFIFGSTNLGYNFLEDFQRFNATSSYYYYGTGNNHNQHYYNVSGAIRIDYIAGFDYNGSYNVTFSAGDFFYFPLETDPEADTLYSQGHGLSSGSPITVTTSSGSNIVYRTDTSSFWSATPTTSTFSSGGSSSASVASADRIRLSSASRLHTAAGTYSISGSVTNSTKNSFYISGHDLVDSQSLTFSTTGTVPTTTTGATNAGFNTLQNVYDGVKSGLDSVKTSMGNASGELLINGSAHYYPFTSQNSLFTANGSSGRQYFYWYINQLRAQWSGSSTVATLSGSNFATGTQWDPFSNTSIGGQGFYHVMTPYASNSKIPYFINAWQVPNPANVSASTIEMYMSSRAGYNYALFGTRGNENNNYSNWSSLSDGWVYTYESNTFAADQTYHGMISLTMLLMNTNWSGHSSSWTSNIYYPSGRYPWAYSFGSGGTRYHIEMLIPIKVGQTNNYSIANMAATVAGAIKTNMTNPTLSTGIVYANPINANRFSLKTSNNIEYNLTNHGSAPFTFATQEETGALDGYYSVDTNTNTTIGHFASAEIPKRVITVSNSDVVTIGGNVYINSTNYKMQTTQKVVYTESGGSIPGLVDGTTYYVSATGPDHFELSTSADGSESGDVVSIATTSAGTFTFTTPAISGISSANGTIGISSASKTITGTDTLFRRFFRTGDTLKISDTTQTLPTYRNFEVASVIDDTELSITEVPGITIESGTHYVETKINTRPDGTFVHRPFDGGVEITAGTSPNSSIVRQTRKYFRYQSGKGIQCSVAINFNPSRIANTLVSVANTSLSVKEYSINVNNNESISYNISGNDRDGRLLGENNEINIMKGDTVNFIVNATGHPFWIKTDESVGTRNSVTTGITNNGSASGTVTWDTTSVGVGTYYYNCQNHASMRGTINVEAVGITTSIATLTTKYPHGLTRKNDITIRGASDVAYNGTFSVQASDDFTLNYYIPNTATLSNPDGIIEYNIDNWANSVVRCGLFDYQNGMFFEFDGSDLYAVRRSSVQQLSGTASVQYGSNIVNGTDTNFTGQLEVGNFIVIRGTSYRITNLASKTEIHIQPSYRGIDASGVIVTKTIDTKVPQSQWNVDKADGTGPSGFVLDITKIQMAYIDYSWYGAGKIRFGFKDANGHVKYMHEFLHNNINTEAYMRSGNIPGRYEIENTSATLPTYVPSLFHWGTSVIMDGRFDDDKAYLFTASSNSLNFTNGDSNTVATNANSTLVYQYDWSARRYNWYVRLSFASSSGSSFTSGTALYTADNELDGDLVDYITYSGANVLVHIFVGSSRTFNGSPAVYPSVSSATDVSIGAPASGGDQVNLQDEIPLISIRLSPSADNNLTGAVGRREIINRMQLQLKQLGITLSHDCTVDVILNGGISNRSFQNVQTPSLSELIKHEAGDKVIGGTVIYSLRASGGSENAAGKRLSSTTDFDISQITDLGNAILGGDGTFPNGPDLLTIAIVPIDTSEINADTPLTVSSRITWTESQA